MCQGSLPVIVRSSDNLSVAVKGRAANLILESGIRAMRISNVSLKGMEFLGTQQTVQVEFVMMSTKVVFVSQILLREQNNLLIQVPNFLVSIERRKNARHATTPDLAAFLRFSIYHPMVDDLAAAPWFPHCAAIGSQVGVADLSLGGLCAIARFPALNNVLRRGLIDDKAKLILPMQTPLDVGVEVRWFKKIKEHVRVSDGQVRSVRSYRFGLEFVSQSEAAQVQIRSFIQQLSQADAI
jgi:hypothetical protein